MLGEDIPVNIPENSSQRPPHVQLPPGALDKWFSQAKESLDRVSEHQYAITPETFLGPAYRLAIIDHTKWDEFASEERLRIEATKNAINLSARQVLWSVDQSLNEDEFADDLFRYTIVFGASGLQKDRATLQTLQEEIEFKEESKSQKLASIRTRMKIALLYPEEFHHVQFTPDELTQLHTQLADMYAGSGFFNQYSNLELLTALQLLHPGEVKKLPFYNKLCAQIQERINNKNERNPKYLASVLTILYSNGLEMTPNGMEFVPSTTTETMLPLPEEVA